jgi:3-oxoacyl-[acyl-carrier protein] reductase
VKEVAIVTGGSRGLGAAIAGGLARDGYHVHLTFRTREDRAKDVIASLKRNGGSAECSPLDLNDLDAVADFAERLCSVEVTPKVLVNCAAELVNLPFEDTEVKMFVGSLIVNCVAPFLLSQRLGQKMRDNGGGSIVNVSSVLAVVGGHDRVAYTTSKAALIGLTKALAVELSPSVRVNAILPGLFVTDMNASLLGDEQRLGEVARHIPLRRLGSPEEFAEVATFLAGPRSGYVTGAIWEVDGGVLSRSSLPSGDAS